MIEEESGEEADADAEFKDANRRRPSCFLGFIEGGEQQLGGVPGQRTVVVDDEGDWRGVGNESLIATLTEVVFLAKVPFERISKRHKALDEIARRIRLSDHVLGIVTYEYLGRPGRYWHENLNAS